MRRRYPMRVTEAHQKAVRRRKIIHSTVLWVTVGILSSVLAGGAFLLFTGERDTPPTAFTLNIWGEVSPGIFVERLIDGGHGIRIGRDVVPVNGIESAHNTFVRNILLSRDGSAVRIPGTIGRFLDPPDGIFVLVESGIKYDRSSFLETRYSLTETVIDALRIPFTDRGVALLHLMRGDGMEVTFSRRLPTGRIEERTFVVRNDDGRLEAEELNEDG